MANPKCVIISPVRDEEQYLEYTIRSVIQQTATPAEWIIVDDGSSDNSAAIASRYADQYPWISVVRRSDRGSRVPGTGVIQAFYDGVRELKISDWEFIMKLDGDVGLQPDYFERCFQRFEADPALGICGGSMYCIKDGSLKREHHPAFHVRGPIKLYRRACWNAIDGLIIAPGWDTVDEVEANRLGWRTQTFSDLEVIHYRPTGAVQGVWRDGVKMGTAAYISGYHPLFMAVKCLKRILQKPYVCCAIAHASGYLAGYFKEVPRVNKPAFIRYIRTQQLRRLALMDSIWK